jgi:hypothetical protein
MTAFPAIPVIGKMRTNMNQDKQCKIVIPANKNGVEQAYRSAQPRVENGSFDYRNSASTDELD